MNPLYYLKAIAATIGGGLAAAYLGLDDGYLTAQEWVGVIQGALVAGIAAFAIPNKTKEQEAPQQVEIVQTEPVVVSQNTGSLDAVPAATVTFDLDGR